MRWLAAALIVLILAAGGCSAPSQNAPVLKVPVFHF